MDIKLYHGGVVEYRARGYTYATPVRRIAEGYAMLSYYFHREMGAETQPVVETGTGGIGRLDEAHALSYRMAEWNVLATDAVEAAPAPPGSAIRLASVCDDTECQHCGTAHRVAETRMSFIYCLCDRAYSPRLDEEHEPAQ